MAEPWDTLRVIFTPVGVIGAVAAVYKLLFVGRIDDVHGERDRVIKESQAERDRAITDRNYFRDLLEKERASHDKLKAHWKDSVIAQREARRVEEFLNEGSHSVPPLSTEEPTGRFFVDEEADQEWRRRNEEKRMRQALDAEELARGYVQDMDTPPAGFEPKPAPSRPAWRPKK
jgi:hypothetical protein